MGKLFVVAFALAVRPLMFLAEVTAAAFLAGKSVAAHEFAELEEVGQTTGAFESLIERLAGTRDVDVGPKFLAELGDFDEGLFKAFLGAGHPAVIPHEFPKTFMEFIHRSLAFGAEQTSGHIANMLLGGLELGSVG